MKSERWWKLAVIFALIALSAFLFLWLRASGASRAAPPQPSDLAKNRDGNLSAPKRLILTVR
jgi:hypothetical protein